MARTRRAVTLLPLLGLVLVAVLSRPAPAQWIEGLVLEQGRMAPVPGASVEVLGAGDEPLGATVTDGEGAFRLEVPGPGTFRVRARLDGLRSAAETVEVEEEGVVQVGLVIPSPLFAHGMSCPEEERRPGTGVLAGIVWDPASEVALPEARVRVHWSGGEAVVPADARGFYRVCAVPVGRDVEVEAGILGRSARLAVVRIERPALAFHDIEVRMDGAGVAVAETRLRAGDPDPQGRIVGRLVDEETGEPVAGTAVALVGADRRSITDGEGRFVIDGLTPGRYELEVRHFGYELRTAELSVAARTDVVVDLRLAVRAIEIEGITVLERARLDGVDAAVPHRRHVVAGDHMDRARERGATMEEVIRDATRGLGVRVRLVHPPVGTRFLCVQPARRVASLPQLREEIDPDSARDVSGDETPGCDPAAVYVDDVRVVDGARYLLMLNVNDVESVEYLPPLHGATRYGLAAANGAIVVHTRGRGPHWRPRP